jgi:hypothetical protein
MIFLYILEYLAIGFLLGKIGIHMDDGGDISNENAFLLASVLAWPLILLSFIFGYIKGFYDNIINKN